MKKVLITMAVLTGLVAGGMVFSSFATPKQDVKKECAQTKVKAPTYWEGYAYLKGNEQLYIYIKVYQVEGMCNSFQAVVVKDRSNYWGANNEEVWVKENPYYDPSVRTGGWVTKKYYVTCNQGDFYFNM